MAPIVKKKKTIKKMDNSSPVKNLVISGQLEKQIENKKNKVKKIKAKSERGVVFIKNLPQQFLEAQIKKYFKQFGKVTNLRLVRSKRTGNTKGFAYVEFEVPEVAQVVAETMNNYVMFQKLIKAAYIPPEEQIFNYFRTSVKMIKNSVGRKKFVSNITRKIMRKMKEQNNWNEETYSKRTVEAMKKLDKIKKKYANLGIDFDNLTVKPGEKVDVDVDVDVNDSISRNESNDDAESSDDDGVDVKNSIKENGEEIEIKKKTENSKLNKKRKASPGDVTKLKSKKIKTKQSNSPKLEDILKENIKDEDSSDEDFIPENSLQDEEIESLKRKSINKRRSLRALLQTPVDYASEEESYSSLENLDSNDEVKNSENSNLISNESNENSDEVNDFESTNNESDNIEEEEESFINFVEKPMFTKIDTFEKLTKRKPHLGAIQKQKYKSNKLKESNKKEKLKVFAAKELMKSQKRNDLKKLQKNNK